MAHLDLTLSITAPQWKQAFPRIRPLARRAIMAVLKHEGIPAAGKSIAIAFANDEFLRALNHQFRGKDKPTNILSFAGENEEVLGDLALAFETVLREATEQQKTPEHHLTHLLVHGTLHLLGYDHEQEDEAEAMESIEIVILHRLGIENPYEYD